MSLALPAFGQTTAVWGETCMFRDEVFALRARSPPMGYKNLMCEAQSLRRRSHSSVVLPPPVSDRATRIPGFLSSTGTGAWGTFVEAGGDKITRSGPFGALSRAILYIIFGQPPLLYAGCEATSSSSSRRPTARRRRARRPACAAAATARRARRARPGTWNQAAQTSWPSARGPLP